MNCLYFIFNNNGLLLERQADGAYTIPFTADIPVKIHPWTHVMAITPMDDGTPVRTFHIDTPRHLETACPPFARYGYVFMELRTSFYHLPNDIYLKAGKCRQMLYWDKNSQFCGVCGSPMRMHTDFSKRCTRCGKEIWPQIATAVIVLVRRGDEVLLVHAHNFQSDFYGLVAGFVETGETLEQAVAREVMEETGITIGNITYFDSQPWPYPCGLMVGYTADYVCGNIRLQKTELAEAGWFHYDHMPRIPQKLSIARRLIDTWLAQYGIVTEQD